MINYKEFSIESKPDLKLRIGKVTVVEIASLPAIIDFDDFSKTQQLYTFIFEHVEVMFGDKWVPLKTKGREVYMPPEIETDLKALNEVIAYFMDEVTDKVFQKSSE